MGESCFVCMWYSPYVLRITFRQLIKPYGVLVFYFCRCCSLGQWCQKRIYLFIYLNFAIIYAVFSFALFRDGNLWSCVQPQIFLYGHLLFSALRCFVLTLHLWDGILNELLQFRGRVYAILPPTDFWPNAYQTCAKSSISNSHQRVCIKLTMDRSELCALT